MNTITGIILLGIIGPFQMFIFGGFALILVIIPFIFYLLTLQNTLKEISLENRRMQPGLVWLNLIPLFGLVWQFVTVTYLADSLKAEFGKRQITGEEERPGYIIGLVYCIFFAISAVGSLIGSIIHLQHWPELQGTFHIRILSTVAGTIFWIIYWVKINGYKNRLLQNRIE